MSNDYKKLSEGLPINLYDDPDRIVQHMVDTLDYEGLEQKTGLTHIMKVGLDGFIEAHHLRDSENHIDEIIEAIINDDAPSEQKGLLSRFRKSVDGSYVVEDSDVFEGMHNEWVGDNEAGFFRRLDEKGDLSIFMPFNTIGLDRTWIYEQILDNAIGGYGDNDSVKDSSGLAYYGDHIDKPFYHSSEYNPSGH